ncbi:hypothetical protein F4553_008050 [Allocatelliglobosispora scoriae]|uniref:Replication-relaxation n=1 Tax=Allocatelliglobosispora scoriae TaxID=643052 RepID=A0A841C3V9_9ACTN|nr:replication-relaxation family protein [Allocatelliglobosispora scoriae]MBB5874616.1 hypothetical protein [Allocatelliglobosispora scoriae]
MAAPRHTSLLALYPRITARDRHLLQLLDDHQVLTTPQIHTLLFGARRTCQERLGELHTLGLIDRFRFPRPGGGSQPWHWTLGHHGHRFQAAAHGLPEPTARATRDRTHRLSANPRLNHLTATNDFFVRLAAHTRTDPARQLTRWWSERTATERFLGVRPDGHGIWTTPDTSTGFFLECDLGTETLHRVAAKLDGYARLAAGGGPRYPVLFWLGNPGREEHLHPLLRGHVVVSATSGHDSDPSGSVWLPAGGWHRVHLGQLPSSHGPDNAVNPNWRNGVLDLAGDHQWVARTSM